MSLPYGPGTCLTCGREIDDARALETNYLHGEFGKPGGPQDWYPCGGCLNVFRITWEPIRSIGDDAWAMFPTSEVLITGAAVAHVIERLHAAITASEPARAFEELRDAPESWRLFEVPEVVAAAWPAFGGHAITATHQGFAASADRVVRLYDEKPEVVERLLREPEVNGIRRSKRPGESALMMRGTRVQVVGSRGPFVHVRHELAQFELPLERLSLDPSSP